MVGAFSPPSLWKRERCWRGSLSPVANEPIYHSYHETFIRPPKRGHAEYSGLWAWGGAEKAPTKCSDPQVHTTNYSLKFSFPFYWGKTALQGYIWKHRGGKIISKFFIFRFFFGFGVAPSDTPGSGTVGGTGNWIRVTAKASACKANPLSPFPFLQLLLVFFRKSVNVYVLGYSVSTSCPSAMYLEVEGGFCRQRPFPVELEAITGWTESEPSWTKWIFAGVWELLVGVEKPLYTPTL